MPDRNHMDDNFNDNFDDDFLDDEWSKYDGVEFIRSTEIDDDLDFEDLQLDKAPKKKAAPVKKKQQPAKKKRVKGKSQYSTYMAITAAIGAALCILAFVVMFSLTRSPSAKPSTAGNEPDLADIGDTGFATVTESDMDITGLVLAANAKEMTVIDVQSENEYIIVIDGTTRVSDSYGTAVTMNQVGIGDIVDVDFNSVSKKAGNVQLSPAAWERKSVSGVKMENGQLTYGNERYTVPDNVVILPSGSSVRLSDIADGDLVSLKGYGDKVRTVTVEKRQGFLRITNYSKIEDGALEVDNDIYKALEEVGQLPVAEGLHTVVVSGNNIDTFTRSVTIEPGETTILDLTDVQIKTGLVVLKVTETNYRLYVNGEEEINTSEPLTLEYGSYRLRVDKEGYDSWTQDIVVNQPTVTVNVTLNKEVLIGRITVTSVPEGGSVYIDNAYIGIAPVRTTIEYGEHRLTVKMDGYDDSSTTILVDGENRGYQMILHPKTSDSTGTTDTGSSSGSTIPSDMNSYSDTPVIP